LPEGAVSITSHEIAWYRQICGPFAAFLTILGGGALFLFTATAFAQATTEDWTLYHDAELGFSFPLPPGLTMSEGFFDLTGHNGNPDVVARALSFRNAQGLATVSVGSAPNPNDLPVEEWVDAYTPCLASYQPDLPQPYATPIAGELGWVCPVTQYAEPSVTIYFKHGGAVFVLSGNVYGSSEDNLPATISEADFQRIVDGFTFDAAPGQLPGSGGSPGNSGSHAWGVTAALAGLLMAAGTLTVLSVRGRSH
jgi:hypothetical protein